MLSAHPLLVQRPQTQQPQTAQMLNLLHCEGCEVRSTAREASNCYDQWSGRAAQQSSVQLLIAQARVEGPILPSADNGTRTLLGTCEHQRRKLFLQEVAFFKPFLPWWFRQQCSLQRTHRRTIFIGRCSRLQGHHRVAEEGLPYIGA